MVGLLRQSVFGRLAGHEDVNDAERLRHDPALRTRCVGSMPISPIRREAGPIRAGSSPKSERLFARFYHQVDTTYVNRLIPPARGKLNWANLRGAAVLAFNVVVRVGLKSDYRRPFWRAARRALRRGQIDAVLGMGFMAHHLIQFTREALRGQQNASFYSAQSRRSADAAAARRLGETEVRSSKASNAACTSCSLTSACRYASTYLKRLTTV